MQYVALDFETANSYKGNACAIGLVRFDEDGKALDDYYSLISPKVSYFDPRMTMVHGLSSEECLASPSFASLWPDIREFINNDLVVAHFAQFDMGVLKGCLEVYDLPSTPVEYVCTCNLGRKVWPGLGCYKLRYLSQYLNLQEYRQHYALDDALVCGKLMYRECTPHLLERETLSMYLASKGYSPKTLSCY